MIITSGLKTIRQTNRQATKGMQAHTLGPLRKIFYIKPEVYNKLREIAMEKRISIDDCAEELLREHFMLEEFIKGIDLDSDLEYYR